MKPSRKLKQHPCVPETSEHAIDLDSRREDPDLVNATVSIHKSWKHFFFYSSSSYCSRFLSMCWFVMGCTSLFVLDGAASSESQTGKQHLSFVNKGKTILHFTSWYLFSQGVITSETIQSPRIEKVSFCGSWSFLFTCCFLMQLRNVWWSEPLSCCCRA